MTTAAHPQQPEGPQPFDPAEFWPKYVEKVQTLEKQVEGAVSRSKAGIEPDIKNDILPLLKDAVDLLGMQQLAAVEYVVIPGTLQQMVPAMLEQILPEMLPDIIADLAGDRLTVESAALLREVILDMHGRCDPGGQDAELGAKVHAVLELIKDAEEDEDGPEETQEDAAA